ncbi:AAA family ATPase [Ruegeria atlantica]|uniref:AAA family ATPase n=1 Tax=Ruegeria atlantica TaxID=81569 RepID=UPI001480A7D5|nr:AAA family ATPase [Ruegeria atlantica]
MPDVASWLAELGLEKYARDFDDVEIDFETLPALTEEDLVELGLPLGPKRKVWAAIQRLNGELKEQSERAFAPVENGGDGKPSSEGERRQLTVMFVDLVGSTALSAQLDAEEMSTIIRTYQNAVAGEIARFEGHVAKFMGDGVIGYFGWPKAHEDEAERAVRAGLAIVRAVENLNVGGQMISCRVGIATGIVVVGELVGRGTALEQTVVGDAPNLAARLEAQAGSGEVLVSEATQALITGAFEMEATEPLSLKGIDGPVAAYRVIGEQDQESRFSLRSDGMTPPLVGRDQELALLLERWKTARNGEGQVVLLVGEAGIGKSRIMRALEDAIGNESHTRLMYQCSPFHGDTAFWPVTQQLHRAARWSRDDDNEARLTKLETLFDRDDMPIIAKLVGLDGTERYGPCDLSPAALRSKTLDVLSRQVLKLANQRPVAFFLEDAHWIDPTTLELLELTIDAIEDAPVLIVLTSRPDNQPDLAAHPHATRLALNRLGRAGVDAIVERLGGRKLTRETMEAIIERTDGIPLFVEELTKAVVESGQTAIPASLHDSLMARLDRTPKIKEIAQSAACIGREFDLGLLVVATEGQEDELREGLAGLASAELVFRRGVGENERYVFKHALVRDAAYESLLLSRRRVVHERLAAALGNVAPPEIVARHAEAAGLTDKAIELYREAGKVAFKRPTFREAAAHYNSALRLLEQDGNRLSEALSVAAKHSVTLIGAEGYTAKKTIKAFERARQLLDGFDDAPEWPVIRYGEWVSRYVSASLPEAEAIGHAVLNDIDISDQHRFRSVANRMVATSRTMMGRFADSLPYYQKALNAYDPSRDSDQANRFGTDGGAAANVYLALTHWCLGNIDIAYSHAGNATATGDQPGHPALSRAYILGHLCYLKYLNRDADALQWSNNVLAVADQAQIDIWRRIGLTTRAAIHADRGDFEAALVDADDCLAALIKANTLLFTGFPMRARARAYIGLGMLNQAENALAAIEPMMERTSQRWDEADTYCARGELALAFGDPDKAERCYREAIRIAQEQSALSWERRAAIPLAHLMADRGAISEALKLLTDVQNKFRNRVQCSDHNAALELLTVLERS